MPNHINEAITDSVTQVNTKVLGDTPATAMGNLMLTTSQALGVAAQNLITGQQQANVMWQAATVQGINALMNTGNGVAINGQRGPPVLLICYFAVFICSIIHLVESH